jgi:hypothetical protein
MCNAVTCLSPSNVEHREGAEGKRRRELVLPPFSLEQLQRLEHAELVEICETIGLACESRDGDLTGVPFLHCWSQELLKRVSDIGDVATHYGVAGGSPLESLLLWKGDVEAHNAILADAIETTQPH